jgi:Mn2+/Fe2+ NRAMP family transporter
MSQHTTRPRKPPVRRPAGKPVRRRRTNPYARQLTPAAGRKTPDSALKTGSRSTLLGALFLAATAAIGPGFLTQTTVFTASLGAAFAFAIVASVLVDIAVQLNVWRVIGVSGRRAQELGNLLTPRLGTAMAALLFAGGLVFTVGNVSGTGLGLQAVTGLDPRLGAALSAIVAIGIFLFRRSGVAMDRVVVVLGAAMLALAVVVAVRSGAPLDPVLRGAVQPSHPLVVLTLVGGTIGGYITYAGPHRLLDSGVCGPAYVRKLDRVAVGSILLTAAMRIAIFLAVLGTATVAGSWAFGAVLWAGATASLIGAAYTTVTFVTSRTKTTDSTRTVLIVLFIAVSTVAYLALGTAPTKLLVFAGAFNGALLPLGIGVLLWVAWLRPDLLRGHRYPRWLLCVGGTAWLLTVYLAVRAIAGLL